jgi:hypothetical protein
MWKEAGAEASPTGAGELGRDLVESVIKLVTNGKNLAVSAVADASSFPSPTAVASRPSAGAPTRIDLL